MRQYIFIIGAPGSGKTTLANKITYTVLWSGNCSVVRTDDYKHLEWSTQSSFLAELLYLRADDTITLVEGYSAVRVLRKFLSKNMDGVKIHVAHCKAAKCSRFRDSEAAAVSTILKSALAVDTNKVVEVVEC